MVRASVEFANPQGATARADEVFEHGQEQGYGGATLLIDDVLLYEAES